MDWPTAYEAVKAGTVDFYCVARFLPEREKDFDFSSYYICNEEMNLYTLPDKDVYYEEFSAFNNMTFGVLENSNELTCFKKYSEKNNFNFKVIEYPTNKAVVDGLNNGEVDAIALVKYSVADDYKQIGNFGVSPAYLMSCEGSALMKEFNAAQEELYYDNHSYAQNLEEEYYGDTDNSSDLHLTREETEYIKSFSDSSKLLNVAVTDEMGPFEYYDVSAKKYSGVTIDIFNKISELTGLKFSYTLRNTNEELVGQMKNEEVQLIGNIAQNSLNERQMSYSLSTPFYNTTFSLASKELSLLSKKSKIAISERYSAFESIAQKRGYENIIKYPTLDETLDAVAEGKADAAIFPSMCESYLLNHAKYKSLETLLMRDTETKVCIGVSNSCSPLLLSIINKCLKAIKREEIDNSFAANSLTATPKQSLYDYYSKNPARVIVSMALILAVAAIYVIRTQKIKQQRQINDNLLKQHKYLQHLYDTLPCGVFQYSYESPHKIINNNQSSAKIYGYDSSYRFEDKEPSDVVTNGTEEDFLKNFELCEKKASRLFIFGR